jgi:hypothetical protein
VNHGWLCSGEDVCQGLAQELLLRDSARSRPSISTKLHNESQVQIYFSLHFLHTNS